MYSLAAPRVFGLSLRVLGDQHLAEEVTQEVFLEVWQRAGHFDPTRGSGLSWLMSIAHHKAVDRVRRTESSRRRDTSHAGNNHRTPYDETASSAVASLDAQWVRSALGLLSTVQRQAIELAYLGGYTHTEISSMLHVPLGTAKGRIRDGLLLLRDVLIAVPA